MIRLQPSFTSLLIFLNILLISPAASVASFAVPHLYAVEGNGKLSFLFGTQHSKIPLSKFPKFVLAAFDSRAVILKETTVGAPFWVPQIPESTPPSARASAALRERGIPEYMFTSPWICSFYNSWDPGQGDYLDLALEKRGNWLGKPVRALDNKARSANLSIELFLEALKCELESTTAFMSSAELKRAGQVSLNSYFQGDLSRIIECFGECALRTKNWIDKIEMEHQETGAFVLVGVAHLVGPGGAMHLLRNRGYTLTQVKSAGQFREILARNFQP